MFEIGHIAYNYTVQPEVSKPVNDFEKVTMEELMVYFSDNSNLNNLGSLLHIVISGFSPLLFSVKSQFCLL